MKKKTLLALSCSLFVFNSLFSQHTDIDLLKLNWLEGTWTRTNNKPGRSGNERWGKNSAGEWLGYGVNMKGADTAFVEKLKIILKDGNIYYVADVPENKEPVFFRFTSLTEKGFVCENPQHDFPKKIAYERTGDKLRAVISGDGKSIEYLFEKKSK